MTSARLPDYPAASARRSENSLEQISFPYPFFFFAVQNIQRNFEVPGAPCCVIKQGIEGMGGGCLGGRVDLQQMLRLGKESTSAGDSVGCRNL